MCATYRDIALFKFGPLDRSFYARLRKYPLMKSFWRKFDRLFRLKSLGTKNSATLALLEALGHAFDRRVKLKMIGFADLPDKGPFVPIS